MGLDKTSIPEMLDGSFVNSAIDYAVKNNPFGSNFSNGRLLDCDGGDVHSLVSSVENQLGISLGEISPREAGISLDGWYGLADFRGDVDVESLRKVTKRIFFG